MCGLDIIVGYYWILLLDIIPIGYYYSILDAVTSHSLSENVINQDES